MMFTSDYGTVSSHGELDILRKLDSDLMRQRGMHPLHAVVYTKPNCVQCKMTMRMMDELGISYVDTYYGDANKTNSIDIQSPEKRKRTWSIAKIDKLKEKYRIQQLPLVKIIDDDTGEMVEYWSGFKPNRIHAYEQ